MALRFGHCGLSSSPGFRVHAGLHVHLVVRLSREGGLRAPQEPRVPRPSSGAAALPIRTFAPRRTWLLSGATRGAVSSCPWLGCSLSFVPHVSWQGAWHSLRGSPRGTLVVTSLRRVCAHKSLLLIKAVYHFFLCYSWFLNLKFSF